MLVLFLTIYFSLRVVTAKPIHDVFYLEGINFQYKNNQWICGDVECPAKTFGCQIIARTNEKDRLYQAFNCMDRDKAVILGTGDIIVLSKTKTINIDLETYDEAFSHYSISYAPKGYETANGVVAVDGLAELKAAARRVRNSVDGINA